MIKTHVVVVASIIFGMAAAAAQTADPPSPVKYRQAGDLGKILTGPDGMTLYI
jgi:hypothetical protein